MITSINRTRGFEIVESGVNSLFFIHIMLEKFNVRESNIILFVSKIPQKISEIFFSEADDLIKKFDISTND